VAVFLAQHAERRDDNGRQLAVRNGYLPERDLITGIGPVRVKQPRVDDRRLTEADQERFSSAILPRYARRPPSVDNLILPLYLKGVSSGDFSEALQAILGEGTGLSATNVVRLKAAWGQEYQQWRRRDLNDQQYVYFWADGIHVNVRLDAERSCILVIMGADEHARAFVDGELTEAAA
jgi:transposase-like protein